MGIKVFSHLHGEEAPVHLIFLIIVVICWHKDLSALNSTNTQYMAFSLKMFCLLFYLYLLCFATLGIQPRASDTIGKYITT